MIRYVSQSYHTLHSNTLTLELHNYAVTGGVAWIQLLGGGGGGARRSFHEHLIPWWMKCVFKKGNRVRGECEPGPFPIPFFLLFIFLIKDKKGEKCF